MHNYLFATSERTFNVFMDREDLLAGDCVVIGSVVYRVLKTEDIKGPDGIVVKCEVEKVGDKLFIGMLSEW